MADGPDRAAEAMPAFVTGSTMRHVAVMTTTGAVGLMAVFVVDLLSLLYVSRLGDPRLTAAVGFATIVQYFAVSINVGLMIAAGALVSRALGARDRPGARRIAGSVTIHLALVAIAATLALLPALPVILGALGADPGTREVAERFLWITLPSNVLMALGMAFSGILRAAGDARRAMYVTLSGAVLTAVLDPILIFALGLGIDGAALTTVVSRLTFTVVGWHGAARVHGLLALPRPAEAVADLRRVLGIALPAVMTNLAPPFASAVLARVISGFGEVALAGNAVVDRLTPVAFGGLFALSGAVGPILGQNWGARRFDRMRQVLRDSAVFAACYVGLVWIALLAAARYLPPLFQAPGAAADLILFFCLVSGPVWFFNGLLFVANASFNNLGFPLFSTAFNWGRATVGTIPFALLGAHLHGPEGALAGVGLGSAVFGTVALLTAFRTIRSLEARSRPVADPIPAAAR